MCFAQEHNAVMLKLATALSRVKQSTTEPLHSRFFSLHLFVYMGLAVLLYTEQKSKESLHLMFFYQYVKTYMFAFIIHDTI